MVEEELCTEEEEEDQPTKLDEEGPSKEGLVHANQGEASILNTIVIFDKD